MVESATALPDNIVACRTTPTSRVGSCGAGASGSGGGAFVQPTAVKIDRCKTAISFFMLVLHRAPRDSRRAAFQSLPLLQPRRRATERLLAGARSRHPLECDRMTLASLGYRMSPEAIVMVVPTRNRLDRRVRIGLRKHVYRTRLRAKRMSGRFVSVPFQKMRRCTIGGSIPSGGSLPPVRCLTPVTFRSNLARALATASRGGQPHRPPGRPRKRKTRASHRPRRQGLP
jgi:hypothetical protein